MAERLFSSVVKDIIGESKKGLNQLQFLFDKLFYLTHLITSMKAANILTPKIEQAGIPGYENEFVNAIIEFESGLPGGRGCAETSGNTYTSCGIKPKQKEHHTKNNGNSNDTNVLDVSKPRKSSFVQKNLELQLSDAQRTKIETILNSVKELTDTEKLLLYLKLPTRENETPSTTSTKQEQTFAFQWIRNNLEECDSSANLPKHEVYDEYRAYCESESLTRFLSAPDFGKIVKCIYPNVKARRLGTRGNSKYCYNGLQRKTRTPQQFNVIQPEIKKVDMECKNVKVEGNVDEKACEQTYVAASALVCEWANKLLGRVFQTLMELAKFLVSGSYVSTKSMASFILMSANEESIMNINSRYSFDKLVSPNTILQKSPVKTEVVSPTVSDGERVTNIQSNEVNSTSDLKDQPQTHFIPSVGAQVVPDIPGSGMPIGSAHCGKLKFNEFTIDVNSPVYLSENVAGSSSNKLTHGDVLIDNVNLVVMDKKDDVHLNPLNDRLPDVRQFTSNSIPDILSNPAISNFQKSGGEGKRSRKNLGQEARLTAPYSKNHKLSAQPQLPKNNVNGFHPQSFSSYPSIPSPVVGMQMQHCNQLSPWTLSSGGLASSPGNAYNARSKTQFNYVSNIQKCHTDPMVTAKRNETDQPLTPQHLHTKHISKQTFKAKRNLFEMFNVESNSSVVSANSNDIFLNNINKNNDNVSNLQNVPNIMTLSSKPNAERVVPSDPLKNIPSFTNVEFSEQDDDFSGIASNLDHVDGHELLKSFQSSENWINDWSNMTMPVMNFS